MAGPGSSPGQALVPAIHGFLYFRPPAGFRKISRRGAELCAAAGVPFRIRTRRESEMADTSDIREHMEVIGSDGQHVGTVDHLDDQGRIKLTKSDSSDGQHHYLDMDLVDHVDQHVHLNVSAEEAKEEWSGDDLELEDDDSSTAGQAANDDTWMKQKLDEPR
jgi:hypothetical protein